MKVIIAQRKNQKGVISDVKLNNNTIETKQTVVDNILNKKDNYVTRHGFGTDTDVNVVRGVNQDYLRTDQTSIKEDNLGNLPLF